MAELNGPKAISNKWKWHQTIYTLIEELNTTEKEVYKMNYISALNWLSFFYERNKVAEAQMKTNKLI
jgi:hypothetical protein